MTEILTVFGVILSFLSGVLFGFALATLLMSPKFLQSVLDKLRDREGR